MFAALILAPAILAATPPAIVATKPMCQEARLKRATQGEPGRIRPLGEEPPAKHYYTVVRSVEGCQMPVLASTGEIGKQPVTNTPRR